MVMKSFEIQHCGGKQMKGGAICIAHVDIYMK